MARVKFTSPVAGGKYTGTYSFKDGDTKEVPDEEAARLVKDFPDKFEVVTEKAARPKRDKAMRPGRNK